MQVFQPDNIKVDGGRMRTKASGDAYERDVLLVRDKIVSAPFGQAVLELVGKTTTQPVIIWPGVRNALPAAESHAGLKAYSPDYQGLARDGSSIRGEGGGGLDVIGFMPHGNLGGAEPDVTLLH